MVEDILEFRLKNPADGARWGYLLKSFSSTDVYHHTKYILASSELEHSEPIGLVVSVDKRRFMIPTLLRTVSGPTGQPWSDASSPYGYGGVLCEPFDVQPEVVTRLFTGLRTWCVDRQLVCCVLRSHPLLRQKWLLDSAPLVDFVKVKRRGPTVAVDLREWDEKRQCLAHLPKGRLSDLAFARRSLLVTWNTSGDSQSTIEQFGVFQELYESAMLQLQAGKFFRFPHAYYQRLSELGQDIGIAIAWLGERPVGGAVFMAGRTYAHYHLSATAELGRRHKAATLLMVAGVEWARVRRCQALHLGGGMGCNDTLLHFKESFGGSRHEYGYATLIADRSRYQAMCEGETVWPYHQGPTHHIDPTSPLPHSTVESSDGSSRCETLE